MEHFPTRKRGVSGWSRNDIELPEGGALVAEAGLAFHPSPPNHFRPVPFGKLVNFSKLWFLHWAHGGGKIYPPVFWVGGGG